jgi:16S rRNA (cytosine1402-N4)-methyltransferase
VIDKDPLAFHLAQQWQFVFEEFNRTVQKKEHVEHAANTGIVNASGIEGKMRRVEGSEILGANDDERNASIVSNSPSYHSHLQLPFTFEARLGSFSKHLATLSDDSIDFLLFDLGVSSGQLEDAGRGFSLRRSGRLDMRMSAVPGLETEEDEGTRKTSSTNSSVSVDDTPSAYVVVNTLSKQQLSEIFFKYGQEKYANWMADAIVESRKSAPIETTQQLAKILENAYLEIQAGKKRQSPHRYSRPMDIDENSGGIAGKESGKKKQSHPNKMQHPMSLRWDDSIPRKRSPGSFYEIHPATKCFQALRIYINDEIGELGRALSLLRRKVRKNGIVACISFHPLEDILVKKLFKYGRIQEDEASIKEQYLQKNGNVHEKFSVETIWRPLTKDPISPSMKEIYFNMRCRSAKLRIAQRIA